MHLLGQSNTHLTCTPSNLQYVHNPFIAIWSSGLGYIPFSLSFKIKESRFWSIALSHFDLWTQGVLNYAQLFNEA